MRDWCIARRALCHFQDSSVPQQLGRALGRLSAQRTPGGRPTVRQIVMVGSHAASMDGFGVVGG